MVGNENPRTPPERSQVDASVAYNNISAAQMVPKIFEFKVDCLQIQSEIRIGLSVDIFVRLG